MLVSSQKGGAQTQTPVKQSISYTQNITTSFEIDEANRNRLFDIEKVGMKGTSEVKNISLVVDFNNDLTTTTTITSSNASEPWMTPPSKIIVDKYGSKMYNAQNVLLNQDAYTPEQSQDYLKIKNEIVQNGLKPLQGFTPLSPSNIAMLQQQGFTVQTLEGGVVKAKKGNMEVKYNSSALSYEIVDYEGSKVLSQSIFKYQQYNGRTIPLSKTERRYKTLESGACIAIVTHAAYSNYQSSGLP